MTFDPWTVAGLSMLAFVAWVVLRPRRDTAETPFEARPPMPPTLRAAFDDASPAPTDADLGEQPTDATMLDEEDIPALHAAAGRGEVLTVCALLDAGVDIETRAHDGATALHYADTEPEVTRLLLARGADPNAADDDGATPILLAESLDVVSALLEAGADPSRPDDLGQTPLHFAVDWGAPHVRALLAAGADPNAVDEAGDTPLHWASRYADVETMRALLNGGADPHPTNRKGERPIDVADDDEKRRLLDV